MSPLPCPLLPFSQPLPPGCCAFYESDFTIPYKLLKNRMVWEGHSGSQVLWNTVWWVGGEIEWRFSNSRCKTDRCQMASRSDLEGELALGLLQ